MSAVIPVMITFAYLLGTVPHRPTSEVEFFHERLAFDEHVPGALQA